MRILAFTMACCVAASLATQAIAADNVLGTTTEGAVPLKSIQVIAFAPQGVLLIGDGQGAQLLAVDTGDTKLAPSLNQRIDNLPQAIAQRLGTTSAGVEIIDLAVNPASHKIYVAVRKQDDKQYAVIVIDSAGKLSALDLSQAKYARLDLASAGDSKVSAVTDVAWADDRIVAAGRANDAFSSKIFVIGAPLKHESASTSFSAETYHVSHRKWETKAPMSVVLPLRDNDRTYVVGAFSCTPVVKYPLDSLQPGAVVKGESVIELGSGNRPIDMFVYEKNGQPFVLANTFRFHHARRPFGPSPYWTVKFEQGLLEEDEAINEKAINRLKGYDPATERIQMVESFHGVTQMDKLDDATAVVLRLTDKDQTDLEILPLP